MEKTAQELVAEGLVVALKLEPGKKYVILLDRRSVTDQTLHHMLKWMGMKGLDGMLTVVAGPPKEAILGIEIEEP
jgi:hypothetical protein